MYPAGNLFPSIAQFNASFVDAAGGDFMVLPSSPLRDAAADGGDIGVDAAAFDAASVAPATSRRRSSIRRRWSIRRPATMTAR